MMTRYWKDEIFNGDLLRLLQPTDHRGRDKLAALPGGRVHRGVDGQRQRGADGQLRRREFAAGRGSAVWHNRQPGSGDWVRESTVGDVTTWGGRVENDGFPGNPNGLPYGHGTIYSNGAKWGPKFNNIWKNSRALAE